MTRSQIQFLLMLMVVLFPTTAEVLAESEPHSSKSEDISIELEDRLGIGLKPSLATNSPLDPLLPPKSLQDLVTFAVQNHPALRSELEKVELNRLNLTLKRHRFEPTATIQAESGAKKYPSELGTKESFGSTSSAGLTIRQNLWNGGQDLLDVNAQEKNLETSQLQFEKERSEVEWRVRLLGLKYYQSRIELAMNEEALRNAEEIASLSLQKSQAGQVGKIDLMQSEEQLSRARAQVATAEMRLFEARDNLENVLLLSPNSPSMNQLEKLLFDLSKKNIARPEKSWLTQINTANWIDRQNELKIITKQLEEKELYVNKARRGRWLPSVDLSLSYLRPFDPKPIFEESRPSEFPISTGVSLTWPLWDRSRGGQIDLALQEVKILEAQKEVSLKSLELEKSRTLAQLERLFKLFEFQKTSYLQSKSLFKAKKDLYAAGAMDILSLTNAANDKLRSLESLYRVIRDLQVEWIRLQALSQGVRLQTGI